MLAEFNENLDFISKALESKGLPNSIIWVSSEGMYYVGGRWFLFNRGIIHEDSIRRDFDGAKLKSLGMDFRLIGKDKIHSYLSLYVASNEEDAEYMMIAKGRIKFSIPGKLPDVTVSSGTVFEAWYRFLGRKTKNNFKRLYFGR